MPKPITRGNCKHQGCTNLRSSNREYCQDHKGGFHARREEVRTRTLGETLKKLGKQHPSWVMSYVRQLARTELKHLKKLPCSICGYHKHVELCHIKAIKSFPLTTTLEEINATENIKVLCPNCHWEFDNGLI